MSELRRHYHSSPTAGLLCRDSDCKWTLPSSEPTPASSRFLDLDALRALREQIPPTEIVALAAIGQMLTDLEAASAAERDKDSGDLLPGGIAVLPGNWLPEQVQLFRDAADLGMAWQEAEAALPDGWVLDLQSPIPMHIEPLWKAQAWNSHGGVSAGYQSAEQNTGPKALRALATQLRKPHD